MEFLSFQVVINQVRWVNLSPIHSRSHMYSGHEESMLENPRKRERLSARWCQAHMDHAHHLCCDNAAVLSLPGFASLFFLKE
jgi:hypothetical protein